MTEGHEIIDVCICTFRREALFATLRSIAAQTLPSTLSVRVIVADNDDTDRRRAGIEARAAALGLCLHYVHAPKRNISVARNACLDAARSAWIVFIDDDEIARADWLHLLLSEKRDCQIVFGQSQAQYPDPATPKWVIEADFHSNRIAGNDAPWNGYTANVLLDRRFVAANGLRFREELGQVGGEDTQFFFDAYRAGAKFGYAPSAIVDEPTPLSRTSLGWLALRRFRSGQIHYMLLRQQRKASFGSIAAAAKAMLFFAAALVALPRTTRSRSFALRGALHLGVIASALGVSPYREYAAKAVEEL